MHRHTYRTRSRAWASRHHTAPSRVHRGPSAPPPSGRTRPRAPAGPLRPTIQRCGERPPSSCIRSRRRSAACRSSGRTPCTRRRSPQVFIYTPASGTRLRGEVWVDFYDVASHGYPARYAPPVRVSYPAVPGA